MIIKEVIKNIGELGTTTFITEIIKTAVSTHIKPILQKDSEKYEFANNVEEVVSEYLLLSYDYNLKMNTILFRNQAKTIFDLYYPLLLVKINTEKDKDNREEYLIDEEEQELLTKYKKILIVDTAGMGKSTILKFIAIREITDNRLIPIIIELRRLNTNISIVDYITEQFDLLDKKLKNEDVIHLLKRGKFIILFDGYDEIPNEIKSNVTERINDFIKKSGKNKFIITSRDEPSLSCFGDFEKFMINKLNIEQAFDLIKIYGKEDKNLPLKLIEKIKNDNQYKTIREFLENPLMVSLLYKTYLFKGEVPYKKIGFYRQAYDALYNDHDKTKGDDFVHQKKCNLDIDDFASILRAFAFLSLRINKIELEKDEFINMLKNAIDLTPHINCKTNLVLDDFLHAVPLFQEEGYRIRWNHKSFMEYFAACFICYECDKHKEEIIKSMINADDNMKFHNVLDFCYDLDTKTCRKIMVYELVCKYIYHYNNTFTDSRYELYNKKILDLRKQVTFLDKQIIIKITQKDILSQYKKEGFELSFIFKKDFKNTKLFILGEKMNNLEVINRVLYNKKVDIFSKPFNGTLSEKYYDKVVEILQKNIDINDEYDNTINSPEFFNLITVLLIQYKIAGLDYKKCIEMKSKIEIEVQKETKNSYLFY